MCVSNYRGSSDTPSKRSTCETWFTRAFYLCLFHHQLCKMAYTRPQIMRATKFSMECHSTAPPLCEGSHGWIVMKPEIHRFRVVYQVQTLFFRLSVKKVCQGNIRGERLSQNGPKRVFRVQKQIRSGIGLPSWELVTVTKITRRKWILWFWCQEVLRRGFCLSIIFGPRKTGFSSR